MPEEDGRGLDAMSESQADSEEVVAGGGRGSHSDRRVDCPLGADVKRSRWRSCGGRDDLTTWSDVRMSYWCREGHQLPWKT